MLSEGPTWGKRRGQGPGTRSSAQHGVQLGVSSEAQLRLLLTVRLGARVAAGMMPVSELQAEMSSETSWLHDSDTGGPRVQEEVRHVWLRES